MPGKLITFEGVDGSGKSTQANLLYDALKQKGFDCILVTEPGGTAIGNKIKELVVDSSIPISPITELFLFQASRAQLVIDVITPALNAGKIVLADRFRDSTWVYQGWVRCINLLTIEFTNNLATSGIEVAKTFLLDIPQDCVLGRERTNKPLDRFTEQSKEFFEKIDEGYEELLKYNNVIDRIDSTKSIEEIHQEILEKTLSLLK